MYNVWWGTTQVLTVLSIHVINVSLFFELFISITWKLHFNFLRVFHTDYTRIIRCPANLMRCTLAVLAHLLNYCGRRFIHLHAFCMNWKEKSLEMKLLKRSRWWPSCDAGILFFMSEAIYERIIQICILRLRQVTILNVAFAFESWYDNVLSQVTTTFVFNTI